MSVPQRASASSRRYQALRRSRARRVVRSLTHSKSSAFSPESEASSSGSGRPSTKRDSSARSSRRPRMCSKRTSARRRKSAMSAPLTALCRKALSSSPPASRVRTSVRLARPPASPVRRSGLVGGVFRLVRREKARPRWLLLENVPFMLQLGAGAGARPHRDHQLEDSATHGPTASSIARAFGLPQRRQRVLHARLLDRRSARVLFVDDAASPGDTRIPTTMRAASTGPRASADSGWAVDAVPTLKGGSTIGIPSPPAIIFPSGRIVMPDIRDAERMQGFEDDLDTARRTIAKRGARWKLVGNAVTVTAAPGSESVCAVRAHMTPPETSNSGLASRGRSPHGTSETAGTARNSPRGRCRSSPIRSKRSYATRRSTFP